MDRNEVKKLYEDLRNTIEKWASENDLTLTGKTNVSFDSNSFSIGKLEFKKYSESFTKEDDERKEFEYACYGKEFNPEDYGFVFEHKGHSYKLVALKRTKAVVEEVNGNSRYLFNQDYILSLIKQSKK